MQIRAYANFCHISGVEDKDKGAKEVELIYLVIFDVVQESTLLCSGMNNGP